MKARIRRAHLEDLPHLTEIYNHYVRETAITFDIEPYSVERRRREWFDRFAQRGRHQLFVAEADEGGVRGYAGSTPYRAKAAYETSVEVGVYLAPEATRQRLGTRLYGALFEALAKEDVHRAIAGVTLPNDASLALHARMGFEHVGVMREVGRKQGRYWDVAWLERAMRAG